MSTIQPLREEHHELLPQIEEIRRVADAVGSVPPEILRARMAGVSAYALVTLQFTEEEAIYVPLLGQALNADQAHEMFERTVAAPAAARQSA